MRLAILLLAIGSPVTAAYAQTLNAQVPPSAEAARMQREFEERQPPSESMRAPSTSILPLQEAPPGAEQIAFTLNGIDLSGHTVYSAEELAKLYQDKIGRDVALTEIFALANAITAQYRNDGYVLSRAIVPQQEIHNGRVRIEIVEGYVDRIIVQGADGLKSKELIEDYAAGITRHRPLRMSMLERYLLLIRDIPGHMVESLLRPSEATRGAADLVLQISYDPFTISAGMDNYGNKYLGPLQGNVRLQANTLLQGGDRSILRYLGTGAFNPLNQQELRYFDFNHSMLFGGEGTMLSVSASRIISYPGNTLHFLESKSTSTVFSAEVSHPFIRSRMTNLSGAFQFDVINARNEMLGQLLANDRLRVVRARATADHVDNRAGVTQAAVEISQGLGWFGASDKNDLLSRTRGAPQFTKLNLDIARVQNIHGPFNLFTAVRGQYSPDRLLSSEEFGVGGGEFGRGYDTSEITGDRGLAARLELQYNGKTQWPLLDNYQAFAFYDVGRVTQSKGKDNPDRSLASAGAGIRFNVGDNASGSLTLAQPLTKDVASRSNGKHERPLRALLNFTVRY